MANHRLKGIKYPIWCGIVQNWDDVEEIWHRTFNDELRVTPKDHPVFLTDAPLNPKQNREKMTCIMFETFDVPAMYVQKPAVLSLYAAGRTTGMVVDSGSGVTHCLPVYDGFVLPHAIETLRLAGEDVTDQLMKGLELQDCCYDFRSFAGRATARYIKEKLAYVALDFDGELKSSEDSSACKKAYQLPDEQTITVNSERFHCAEIMFQPEMMGYEEEGVGQMVVNSIQRCDSDLHEDLYGNMVLAGGNTMFNGFVERLQKEVTARAHSSAKVKVVAPRDRKYSAWIGGSILSSMATFQKMWITKAEFEEEGSCVVHRKCL